MKVIGIVGTRGRNEVSELCIIRAKFFSVYKDGDWICSGGCPQGGDRFAEMIAKGEGIPILIFYPKWNKYGKSAGFKRNTEIAKRTDVLIACVSKDRTGGTEDTIKKFTKLYPKNKLIIC